MLPITERLRHVHHVALDMDGTIYSGGTLFPSTLPFLRLLADLRITHTFLTNNSSKSVEDYARRLAALGINCSPHELYTSTQCTVEYLREQMPAVRKVFVLGTSSMRREVAAAGFELSEDSATDEPDVVLVGFDTELVFTRLCRAAYWLKLGKRFIATHPDRICPTDEPTVLVDCGSICAALESATGRAPDVVLGKPDPRMLRGILRRHRLQPENLAMVGDRLYTDMAMARNAGAMGILVLTGEASRDEATAHSAAPDLIVDNLEQLGQLLRSAHNTPEATRSKQSS